MITRSLNLFCGLPGLTRLSHQNTGRVLHQFFHGNDVREHGLAERYQDGGCLRILDSGSGGGEAISGSAGDLGDRDRVGDKSRSGDIVENLW